jgi:hypothetical protein
MGEVITFKYLALALPNALTDNQGIETPVFISPQVGRLPTCFCGKTPQTLIYRVPGTTTTVHRGRWCPGIYHHHSEDISSVVNNILTSSFNFIAFGQSDCDKFFTCDQPPIGRCFRGRSFHAEKVGVITQKGSDLAIAFDGEFPIYYFDTSPAFLFVREIAGAIRTGLVLVLRDGIPLFTHE